MVRQNAVPVDRTTLEWIVRVEYVGASEGKIVIDAAFLKERESRCFSKREERVAAFLKERESLLF